MINEKLTIEMIQNAIFLLEKEPTEYWENDQCIIESDMLRPKTITLKPKGLAIIKNLTNYTVDNNKVVNSKITEILGMKVVVTE